MIEFIEHRKPGPKAGSEFSAVAVKSGELFWSTGALEYWSVGKSESLNFNSNGFFITPLLHHSITPLV
jgi:hypothetical protein